MRPTVEQWGLKIARVTAERSTCYRRKVGCVLLDRRGHVLATGYNGVASGQPHCGLGSREVNGFTCSGALSASGTNLDGCLAIHAEQNALLQCRDVFAIHTICVTVSPCMTCVKMLMNTGCMNICFIDEYPHMEAGVLWASLHGHYWRKVDPDEQST